MPKRGRSVNELTRFRYDAILHVGPDSLPEIHPNWMEWDKDGFTLEKVALFSLKNLMRLLLSQKFPTRA